MNSLLIKIKSLWKKICDFFKINPHKHWAFLLAVFSVLVILLILFSFYLLYKIKNEQIFQVKMGVEEKKNLLKEDLLNQTVKLFDTKALKIKDINSGTSLYKDPSF